MGGAGTLYVAAGVAWLAVVYKALAFRKPRQAVSVLYWLILLCSALAVTALLPPIYHAIDRLTGIPNLARLLGNVAILVASWLVQLSIWQLNHPDRPLRPRVWPAGLLMLAIVIAMGALFAAAPIDVEEATDFTGRYAHEPTIQLYRGVFLGYLAFTAIAFMRLSWRYASGITVAMLLLSECLLISGAALGLMYSLHEIDRIAFALAGATYPVPDAARVTVSLLAGTLILMIVGSTLPTWGQHVGAERPARWLAAYRTYRRLHPLWRALYRAFPSIALHPPRWDSPLTDVPRAMVRPLLYRRGIEIRDGYIQLQRYRDQRARQYAAGLCSRALVSED